MSPLLLRRFSDEQLCSRLASGEAAAFDELYRRYVHRLSAYGANLLGDAASGDDVAQSALLKAYGAMREGRLPDRVKPWLFRIAHNSALDLVARRRELPTAELPERSTGGGESLERSGALVAALASLPERQRRVYVLRELHGLRIDETAAELGLTVGQVEQSLFAARNRLAEHLVFGDRLNCVAVQRLALGPLDGDERRALKTHLRSCPACRSTLGLRGRALELLPVLPFDWLRGLFGALATAGAPAAAKVGAVVATASFAVGVPVALDQASHHARPLILPAVTARVHKAASSAGSGFTAAPLAGWKIPPVAVAASRKQSGDEGTSAPRTQAVELTQPVSDGRDAGGDDGTGSDGGHTAAVPVVALSGTTTATPATQASVSVGSLDGGGGSGDSSPAEADGSSGD
ncbi:MAG TPA: sigma-70 family RNA polymerase sigma factor [Gaiellaceae bacterium]|nr:sigma-70 family RNA polymerase sigma factor [Gaiellaceae bacterium]